MNSSPSANYAGDVDVMEAWTALRETPKAQLVDCRTGAERCFVGLPDLSAIGRAVHCIEWLTFPGMGPNPGFTAEADAALGPDKSIAVYFLCRSGARSRAAAAAMTAAGYTNCFNIAGGFEGDLDPERHRGKLNGWKAAGLPWIQT